MLSLLGSDQRVSGADREDVSTRGTAKSTKLLTLREREL